MTLNQAIAALSRAEDRMRAELRRTAHEFGKVVVNEAQGKLGEYQGAVNLVVPGVAGPFEAWEALTDETIERKLRGGFPTPSPLLRTGDMREGISYHVETSPEGVVVTISSGADYSSYQEFGTEYMPPRSFLMPAVLQTFVRFRKRFARRFIEAILPPTAGYTADVEE